MLCNRPAAEMMQKFKFLSKDKKQNNNENDQSHDSVSVTSDRKLVSRNAVICSSGKVFVH